MTPPVRQHLPCAETHEYLFCKAGGEAFIQASEWTSYLSRIVEDHTGLAVGPTALRHAFTSFMETSTDEDHLRLRESVGRAMRHGSRIQQSVYNDSSSLEMKRRGVEFATDHFKPFQASGDRNRQRPSSHNPTATMSHIDVAIAAADKDLGRLDLHAAFDAYLGALKLILAQFATDTVFAPAATPDASTSDSPATKHFKNSVAVIPEDVERLLGLAHLCLTEVEDIIYGTVSVDDLEPYGEDDSDSDENEGGIGATADATGGGSEVQQPEPVPPNNNSNTSLSTLASGKTTETRASGIPPAFARAHRPADFREHRLSRAHTIRSLERSGTWNSIRNSRASMLGTPSVHTVEENSESLHSAEWLLEGNRNHSPQPGASAASGEPSRPASGTGTPREFQPDNPAQQRLGGELHNRLSGESLIWRFPSVPKRKVLATTPELPPPAPRSPALGATPVAPTSMPAMKVEHLPSRTLSSQPPVMPPPPPRSATAASLPLHNQHTQLPYQQQHRAPSYLPLIPTSPLLHQHRVISEQLAHAGLQLQQLEASQASRSSAAGVLSQIRRLVETTGLAKRKVAQLAGLMNEWDHRQLTDVGPADLARAIASYDVDMFRAITVVDILACANVSTTTATLSSSTPVSPHPSPQLPDPIRRAADFLYFLFRTVQTLIVDTSQPIDRASAIVRWILVAQNLSSQQRDFAAVGAICAALASPAVADLSASWKLVSRKYRAIHEDLPRNLFSASGPDGQWRGYRESLRRVRRPCVPALDALLQMEAGEAVRVLETCREEEGEWDVELGSVASPVAIGPMHWLVTRRWMADEQVERMSRGCEPRRGTQGSIQVPTQAQQQTPAPFVKADTDPNLEDTLFRRFAKLGVGKK
ncbi:hypothetical protein HKX48_003423 [Thoreauomyces humboldtii]|nr:hypothetical protein HKX48_003423 [Thoreauomyces humboldtii]